MQIELNLEGRRARVNNEEVRLTKREVMLCRVLSARPQRLVSRTHLLDLLSEDKPQELSERGLDNAISRLRKKLGDAGRQPEVIETIYGEGYRWVYQQTLTPLHDATSHTLFLYDLSASQLPQADSKQAFLNALTAQLEQLLNVNVHLITSMSDPQISASTSTFCIEACVIGGENDAGVAFNIRLMHTSQSLPLGWYALDDVAADGQVVASLAEQIRSFIMSCEIGVHTQGFAGNPLDVSLFDTAAKYEDNLPQHKVTREHLLALLREHPNDPRAKILMAININNRLLMGYVTNYPEQIASMGELVEQAMPYVQNDALYLSACAEVLYRCHDRERALAMANQAHALKTHPAATLKTLGKLAAFEGDIEQAIQYYDQALAMISPVSTFAYMLLTLKAIAYKAAQQRDALNETLTQMFKLEPKISKRTILKLMFYDGSQPLGFANRALIRAMPKRLVDRIVRVKFVGSARSFKNEQHRENLMLPLLTLLKKLHRYEPGDAELIDSLPRYFG